MYFSAQKSKDNYQIYESISLVGYVIFAKPNSLITQTKPNLQQIPTVPDFHS